MATSTSTPPLLVILAAVATVLVFLPVPPVSAFPAIKPPIHNPWTAFKNLSGCHFGDHRPGLTKLKDYLCHFGYLPTPPHRFTDAFDADLEEAVKAYQRNFGLAVTGALDTSTVTQMMTPRCGVPDNVVNGNSSAAVGRGRNLYTYFPGTPTWPRSKRRLKYAITETSLTPIRRATLRKVMARAFARWSAATTIRFTETAASASDADITIGFYVSGHGDDEAFDGPLGRLAHAFAPTDGRFHLDAAEEWVAGGNVTRAPGAAPIDLESVAVHEIGHLLGLGHSTVEDAVMYASLPPRTRKVDLAPDDVAGIQSLYGRNPR